MKKIMLVSAVVIFSASAQAACYGSGAYRQCTDSSGNSYSVQRYGNSTYVNGTNSRGETWNSRSQRIGNTTYQSGSSIDGGQWNQTIQNNGGTTYYNGSDSNGNSYSGSCGPYGCY